MQSWVSGFLQAMGARLESLRNSRTVAVSEFGIGAQMKRFAFGIMDCRVGRDSRHGGHIPVKYVPRHRRDLQLDRCYIGVHVGAGWHVSDFAGGNVAASGVGAVARPSGCNLQWRSSVIGLEGEFWVRAFMTATSSIFRRFHSRHNYTQSVDGTFAVRSGLAFDPPLSTQVGVAVASSTTRRLCRREPRRSAQLTMPACCWGVGFSTR